MHHTLFGGGLPLTIFLTLRVSDPYAAATPLQLFTAQLLHQLFLWPSCHFFTAAMVLSTCLSGFMAVYE